MIYLATASGPSVVEAIADDRLGQMVTPDAGNRLVAASWALDNGCFSESWSADKWAQTLDRHQPNASSCLFAVVPDVVGDAAATDVMWARWWAAVKRRGFRAAYVAQDGITHIPFGADALFIGGSTEFKLGARAREAVALAHNRRMWVHMGRVNSRRRLRYAADIGCHSVDGTYLAYGPDVNLPRLLSWLHPRQTSIGGVA